jgi:uncharacterized SAM-binding protein YcdF (DUF218 family)
MVTLTRLKLGERLHLRRSLPLFGKAGPSVVVGGGMDSPQPWGHSQREDTILQHIEYLQVSSKSLTLLPYPLAIHIATIKSRQNQTIPSF